MSKASKSRFPPAAAPTMVVIRAPRHRPPRPSTTGQSDCDAALSLRPNWPRLCTHQAFHTSNRIVRSARPRMARTRRSRAGTASRRSSRALAPQLVASAELLDSAADLHRPPRRQQAMREASPTGTRPTGHPAHAVPRSKSMHDASGVRIGETLPSESRIRALNTRGFRVLLGWGAEGAPARGPKSCEPAGPQDFDWSRETVFLRPRVRG
jgi:hypothetical protein